MHSDAQFAGSSSVKSCGLFLLRTSAIQTSLIALGLSSVPAHVEMMGFLGIGNNPMVGCTVACAVDVATALNKQEIAGQAGHDDMARIWLVRNQHHGSKQPITDIETN